MAKRKNQSREPPAVVTVKDVDDYVHEATFNGLDGNGKASMASDANEIVRIIETVFSEENIDQKSFLADTQIEALIEIDSFIAYDIATYGFIDRVQYSVAKDTVVKAKSLNGFGMQKLVELFQPLYNQLKENERIKQVNGLIR